MRAARNRLEKTEKQISENDAKIDHCERVLEFIDNDKLKKEVKELEDEAKKERSDPNEEEKEESRQPIAKKAKIKKKKEKNKFKQKNIHFLIIMAQK